MGYTDSLKTLLSNPVIANLNSGNTTEAMTLSLNWAYTQSACGEIPPPFVNAMQLADEYRLQYPSLTEAADNLIKFELSKISGVGLLTSFGGVASLPANMAIVLLMQMRLVQSMACLAGRNLDDDEVKQFALISLLGVNVSLTTKKKMLEGGIENLLPKIAEKLAPKMLGTVGTSGILKCIPIISGIIGTSLDALTTYGIAKAAQELFLGEIMKEESLSKMQQERIKLLINMAYIDGELADSEKELIQQMIDDSGFSENKREELTVAMLDAAPIKIDFSPFKEEKVYAVNAITGLVSVMNADGKIHPSEKLYLMEIAKEINISKDEIEDIIDSCNF